MRATEARGDIVAFTGIRAIDPAAAEIVRREVRFEIERGATELRFGGAIGVDTIALEAACGLGVACVVYVPFTLRDQPAPARAAITRCASSVVELGLAASNGAYLQRNRAMVNGAGLIVAFTDGRRSGGTAYTIRVAQRANIRVRIVRVPALPTS